MITIGNKVIGDGFPCFITFEAGPTHTGIESAKRLVRYAAESGADAIKFQTLDPDRLMADRNIRFTYSILKDRHTGEMQSVSEPLYDLLKRRALKSDQWREVKNYADSLGILFFSTVGFPEEVDLLVEIGCQSIKIASADLNHLPLIRYAAKTGLCVQVDTGNATLGEVERAVDVIREAGNENIIIHHCSSGYPARLDGINLRVLTTLKNMFPYPIAFSDHSPGWDMDIAAVALGAAMIEKTITEDRMIPSVEHIMSIEPAQMAMCVQAIRDVQQGLGLPRILMTREKVEKRTNVRRSIHLAAPAKAGQFFCDLKLEFCRPGTGLGPDMIEVVGRTILRHDLPAGHRLALEDLEF